MQKNYFDLNLFRFSKYLNDIGILSRLNTERFQKYFHEISSNFYNLENISSSEVNMNIISIKKCLISALITYIQSLSEEDQKILALNIFEKYDKNEIKLEGKLIKLIDIYSKYKLKKCFNKWKSEIFILTNSLKKVISSNILSSIQNSFQPKILPNYKEINTTKENSNNNNTMFNINHHLNISTNPDIFNNYNNYSFHDINIENNINYTYENKNKRKNNSDSNRTYSSNYFNPDQNYINNNYHNDSYNYILNYLNKTNKKNSNKIPLSKERYSTNNSAILNNNHISTHKSKKSKVNLEYIDLGLLAWEVCDSYNSLGNNNVKIYVNYKDDEYIVKGDYVKLKEALNNIIKNSIEAKESDRELSINVRVRKYSKNVNIEIDDNGTGIDMDKVGKCYYTNKVNGNGIGLMFVNNVVKLHDGKIDYIKKRNGTLIKIRIPLAL